MFIRCIQHAGDPVTALIAPVQPKFGANRISFIEIGSDQRISTADQVIRQASCPVMVVPPVMLEKVS